MIYIIYDASYLPASSNSNIDLDLFVHEVEQRKVQHPDCLRASLHSFFKKISSQADEDTDSMGFYKISLILSLPEALLEFGRLLYMLSLQGKDAFILVPEALTEDSLTIAFEYVGDFPDILLEIISFIN